MKERILKLREEGRTFNEIVKLLGCSKATINYHCSPGGKDKTRERLNNLRREKRNFQRAFIRRVKVLKGCIDCGNRDYRVLDYDHVRGEKLYNISHLQQQYVTMKVIKDEIKKCDVRCANCHRIKTYEERR